MLTAEDEIAGSLYALRTDRCSQCVPTLEYRALADIRLSEEGNVQVVVVGIIGFIRENKQWRKEEQHLT